MNTQDKNTLYRLLSPKELIACGYEAINVDGNVKSLTIPNGATYAELRFESSVATGVTARYLMLGATLEPSSTIGMALSNLDFFDIIAGTNMVNFRVIQATAGTHKLHVQYFK